MMSGQSIPIRNHGEVGFGRRASRMAQKVASVMESYSTLIDPVKEKNTPKFDRDEIILGDLLGSGGFNNVFELHQIELDKNDGYYTCEEQERREALLEKSRMSSFAIKLLRPEVMMHKEDFCNSAADLMIETKILANLPHHPNVIRLHGVSVDGVDGFVDCVEGGYFLVLDRMSDTLSQRITTWRKLNNTTLIERVAVASSLSSALKHLHEHNVIFRDLKPDNVGFDSSGILKLFDFGLAKELDPSEYDHNDSYQMSGKTGSRRYMAPEVALSEAYNLSADVFSFSIVMWQICSLQEPFVNMNVDDHMHHVVMGNERPLIDPDWPNKIRNIMKWCWSCDMHVRPPMKEVHRALKRQIKYESQNNAEQPQPQLTSADVSNPEKRKLLMRNAHGQHSYQSLVSVLSGGRDIRKEDRNTIKSKNILTLRDIPQEPNSFPKKCKHSSDGDGLKNVLEEASRLSMDDRQAPELYKKLPVNTSNYRSKSDGLLKYLSFQDMGP